ncbi:MAG: GAF domain-containing protein, partial [Anaerolineales bacterium]|nr:GAF domain-containing protein [Anaerolineales bacterium]
MFRRLTLPVYIDEDKNRTARALQGVLRVLLVVLLITTPILFAIKNLSALLGSCYLLGSIIITWALLKVRRLELASLFFIASSVLLLTYFMLIGQGVHDITIIALPMLLVMAGLTLKRKAYLILAGATVFAVNFVVFAEIHGWFHSGAQSQTTYADLLVVSAILIATIVIVRMLADYLFSSLNTIRQGTQRQRALYLETRAQAEQLRILNQISSAIAAGLDLDRMLEELYVQLKRVLPLDSFYVALIDEKVGVITFPIFYSSGVRVEIPAESLDAGSGLTGEVIRSRKTIYLPDVFDQGAQEEHEIISIGPGETRSYVGLPLHLHGEVFGALSIQSQQPHAYFNDQLRLLETITAQASVAIDNARLFVEATATLRRDERLSEVARVISSTLDLQFILENVVRLAAELLEAD